MSKILKNQTASPLPISDMGITIPASGDYTIPPVDYPLWAGSDDVIVEIGSVNLIVNDGSFDLGISDGTDLIKGIFPNEVSVTGAGGSDTVKVQNNPIDNDRQLDLLSDILKQLKRVTAHLQNMSDLELSDGDEQEY